MKKNITINLSGQLYAIDEDAYQILKSYLDSMESYFLRQEGGDEIAEDIKNRVSELLWERKENGQQAVDIETVKAIIKQIGNPSEIDDTNYGHGPEEPGKTNIPTQEKEKRHFYRDKQDKILGGICAGLAHY
ncbi:MAG: PspC domain-containing protein, partial [Bacteroidaceae bacterium]|nr:PspC domain-containing protein [Bacteroidaceae bacterium]